LSRRFPFLKVKRRNPGVASFFIIESQGQIVAIHCIGNGVRTTRYRRARSALAISETAVPASDITNKTARMRVPQVVSSHRFVKSATVPRKM
jgi:hypothetical protein